MLSARKTALFSTRDAPHERALIKRRFQYPLPRFTFYDPLCTVYKFGLMSVNTVGVMTHSALLSHSVVPKIVHFTDPITFLKPVGKVLLLPFNQRKTTKRGTLWDVFCDNSKDNFLPLQLSTEKHVKQQSLIL